MKCRYQDRLHYKQIICFSRRLLKIQENYLPEADTFSSISKFQISSQLQGCETVGALMGIYLEGIFTTKADIEDDIHAYRHHDISLSSWSQDQALFFYSSNYTLRFRNCKQAKLPNMHFLSYSPTYLDLCSTSHTAYS